MPVPREVVEQHSHQAFRSSTLVASSMFCDTTFDHVCEISVWNDAWLPSLYR